MYAHSKKYLGHTKLKLSAVVLLIAVVAGCGGSGGSPQPANYTVGGTASGLNGNMVLQNNGAGDMTVTASGSFAFSAPLAAGATYAVTVKTPPAMPLQTCTVSNAGVGIYLYNAAFTDDSQNLVIRGSGGYAVALFMMATGSIPSGSYAGNAPDEAARCHPHLETWRDAQVQGDPEWHQLQCLQVED